MMSHSEQVYLGAYWRQRALTAREYIQITHGFLSQLERLSPLFADRCVVVGTETTATRLPLEYTKYEEIVAKVIHDPDAVYANPDPRQKHFTLESKISKGFRVSFSDCRPGAVRDTAVSVSVKAGAHGAKRSTPNAVLIELPSKTVRWTDQRFLMRQLTGLVVDFWNPSFAVLTSRELREALDPNNQYSFTLGALTYFADEKAAGLCTGYAQAEQGTRAGALLQIEAPEPWAKSADLFRPCFLRLADDGLLKWPSDSLGR